MAHQKKINMNHYLYSFRRCPYAMRARMALFISKIPLVIEDIVLRDKPEKMLLLSPKGTVPVLITESGDVLDESLDIMRWALHRNDPDDWLIFDDSMHDLIEENDGSFKKALDRYKYPVRYPDEDCSGARNRCEAFLNTLNNILSKQSFLGSNTVTMIDIALFPFIRQCANTDHAWFDSLDIPFLQKWLVDHMDSKIFKDIMEKPKENVTAFMWEDHHQG